MCKGFIIDENEEIFQRTNRIEFSNIIFIVFNMISKIFGKVALFVVHFTLVRLLVSETIHETHINVAPTRSEHFSLKEI